MQPSKLAFSISYSNIATMLPVNPMAKALGAKKAAMAEPQEVERARAYVLGGVSPLGQKKKLKTAIEQSPSRATG